ncbi:hypothetical protein TXYLGN1_02070 [Tepidimicrobium xylanilyticum]|uniref:Uncharacterized protein n=1 Tax=Tepidimicrobium xylanilyticum TaxID=1123352 RepID=A0A1H3C168_9FIRM|nr:hypothetical protein EN5CB1_21450 [Tepidimicrobium xylanilyticum]SDX47887.1 hypothetical protein SAMN05660923_02386 [Tepidimicrobium xylanilyticum]
MIKKVDLLLSRELYIQHYMRQPAVRCVKATAGCGFFHVHFMSIFIYFWCFAYNRRVTYGFF